MLIDVSETSREAGIKFPCAVTCSVWARYVAMPAGLTGQNESGRLWDVVSMLLHAIRGSADSDCIRYQLYVRNSNRDRADSRDLVTLKAMCGPGDDAEPVITIMLPDED
jgi:hypothetical protein